MLGTESGNDHFSYTNTNIFKMTDIQKIVACRSIKYTVYVINVLHSSPNDFTE